MKTATCIFSLIISVIILNAFSSEFASAQETRTWKDATGKFEIQAKFVKVDGENLILERSDGKKIAVPLAKLSPADQEVAKGLMSGGDDNPFKEIASDDTVADTATMRTLSVDFSTGPEIEIKPGNWNPNLGEQPPLPFKLSEIKLPGKSDFFENLLTMASNTKAKRAVLTHHLGRRGNPFVTRLTLVDLEEGKVLANASGDGKWVAIAIHDDGERIVVQNMSDEEATKGQLGTVRLRGSKIEPLDLWTPYATMTEPGKEKIVRFARFINDGRLLTLSQNGRVVIWDFETRKPVWRFNYHGACEPALTHDRKHLAICGGDIVGFVNLDDPKETPSVKAAPQMNYWLNSAFSPSCKRFAAATMAKLMVWDVESGDVLFEGQIPGLATNGDLHFPHEDFVMINNDKLVEFSSGIKVWRYHGALAKSIDGEMVFLPVGKDAAKLLPVEIPDDKALEWLERAKANSDLFVVKKGAKVAIDLSGVPGNYRGDVEQSLKQQIEKMGFEYAASAPVTLTAKISGPTQEAVTYHFAGSFVVNQYRSSLNINYDGKSIWASSATNVPGAVSGRGQDEVKKQLAEAGKSPNIKFYGSVQLPEFLQKPSGDSKSTDAQMLGASQVTVNGLQ